MKKQMTIPKGATHVRLTVDGDAKKTALETVKNAPKAFDGIAGTWTFLKKDGKSGRFEELGAVTPGAPTAPKVDALVAICLNQKDQTYQRVLANTTEAALRAVGTKFPEGVWSIEKVDDSPDASKVFDIDARGKKAPKAEKKGKKAAVEVPTPSKAKAVVAAVDAGKKSTTATRSAGYVKVDDYMVDLLKANQKSTGSTMTLEAMAKDVHAKYPRNSEANATHWLKAFARKHSIEMSFDVTEAKATAAK